MPDLVDHLIEQAHNLTPLPASAIRLAALASSNEVGLDEIAEVVAYDQALTMRLLRAANSASTGGGARCSRVQEAVFRLGTARVLALTVASGAASLLKCEASAYGLAEGQLWKHSIATAAAAETLSEFAEQELPLETFTAALLHDVGKLVMGRFLSTENLERIQRVQTDGGLTPLAAEREILNVHHGELGGVVAQHWELPQRIVEGIIYHHNPADGFALICDAVYLANIVAKHVEGAASPPVPAQPSLERVGLSADQMDQLIAATRSRFESVSARYNAS